MRKYIFIKVIIGAYLFILLNPLIARNSLVPRSSIDFNQKNVKESEQIFQFKTSKLNKDSLILAEKKLNEDGKQRPQQYGWAYNVNLNTNNSGSWDTLANGDKIWRLKIICPEAYSINLCFENFKLSENSDIYIYNNSKDMIIGPITSRFNKKHGKFGTHLIKGDSITIEYYESKKEQNQSSFKISKIVYGYINAFEEFETIKKDKYSENLQSTLPCNRDVNCPEGDNFCREKSSIALILVTLDGSTFNWCSGTLMNNSLMNFHPYLLSAFHCIDYLNENGEIDQSEIDWLDSWIFRFGYYREGCNSGVAMPTFDYSGADFVSGWNTSDFLLLELEDQPQSGENNFDDVYFSGWDNTGSITNHVTGIHHPRGDVMKISTDVDNIQIRGNPIGLPCNSQPQGDEFFQTIWDTGTTEPGSSGSSLFNSDKRVIGQLLGGCNCESPLNTSYYGRLAISWNGGGIPETRLKDWLDPTDSGVETLDGIKMPHLKFGWNITNGQTINWNAYSQFKIGSSDIAPFTVYQGGTLNLKAGKEIVIRPCTKILSGSNFHAYISPVDCSEIVLLSEREEDYSNLCYTSYPKSGSSWQEEIDFAFDNDLKSYPNPIEAGQILKIPINFNSAILIDLLGNEINLSPINSTVKIPDNVTKGIYLLRLINDKGIFIEKLIVK